MNINYELKDNILGRYAAMKKELGLFTQGGVIHLGVDIELAGGVVAAVIEGGDPHDLGLLRRESILQLVKELRALNFRVVIIQEACGFGYAFHRNLLLTGGESLVGATERLSGARKTDKRDARALALAGYDYTERDNRKRLRLVRVPGPEVHRDRKEVRQRDMICRIRRQLANWGRGLMHDHDFYEVPEGWWGGRKWPKLKEQLLLHDPWLVEMLEPVQEQLASIWERQRLLESRIKVDEEDQENSQADPKGLGALTSEEVRREVGDWHRFQNRKQVGSFIGCCPREASSGGKQRLGAIDRCGNKRVRTKLVEAVWRIRTWNPGWRGIQKFERVLNPKNKASSSVKKKAVVACARLLAIDLWRIETGRIKAQDVGLVLN